MNIRTWDEEQRKHVDGGKYCSLILAWKRRGHPRPKQFQDVLSAVDRAAQSLRAKQVGLDPEEHERDIKKARVAAVVRGKFGAA